MTHRGQIKVRVDFIERKRVTGQVVLGQLRRSPDRQPNTGFANDKLQVMDVVKDAQLVLHLPALLSASES